MFEIVDILYHLSHVTFVLDSEKVVRDIFFNEGDKIFEDVSKIINHDFMDLIDPSFAKSISPFINNINFTSYDFDYRFNSILYNIKINNFINIKKEKFFYLCFNKIKEPDYKKLKNYDFIKFEKFFDFNKDLLCVGNKEGKFVKLNKAWENVLGYSIEELMEMDYLSLIIEEDKNDTLNLLVNLENYGFNHSFINRYLAKNGEVKILEWISYVDDNFYYAIGKDITSLKQIENNLNVKKNKLINYFQNAPIGLLVLDNNLKITELNKSVSILTGFDDNELLADNISKIIPDFNKLISNNFVNEQIPYEIQQIKTEVIKKDFTRINVSLYFNKLDNNILIYLIDITESVRSEHKLIESERRLNEAQEIAKLGNWELDLKSNKLIWSDEIFNIFEKEKSNFNATYESFLNAIHPEDRDAVNIAYKMSLVNKKPYEITHRLLMPDSRIKYVQERCVTFYDDAGIPIRSMGTVQDITELNLIQENLFKSMQEAELANQAKSHFLANMSHEIRTPLNGILGFTDLILMNNKELISQDMLESLNRIKACTTNLLDISNDILEVVKIYNGFAPLNIKKICTSDLIKFIHNSFSSLAENKQLFFKIVEKSILPEYIYSDLLKIEHILINLLSNAIKFTETGKVILTVDYEKLNDKSYLKIEVIDTGIGIPKENFNLIFEPFMQGEHYLNKRYEGVGIGLNIVKSLVELLNGEIHFESEINIGTTFYLRIPIETLDLQHKEVIPIEYSDKKDDLWKGKTLERVLVAEDNNINIQYIQKVFEKLNIKVDFVFNGLEVVNKAKTGNYDLILMDIQLPLQNGIKATLEIRNFDAEIPIVAMTAYAMSDDRDKFLSFGMNEYIAKPFTKDQIEKILKKLYPDNPQ